MRSPYGPTRRSASRDGAADRHRTQSLVAAGAGVTTMPGLALRAHHNPACELTRLSEVRRMYAVTYGEPPDPPATAALLDALSRAAAIVRSDGSLDDHIA